MRQIIFLILILGIISCNQINKSKIKLNYPVTKKVDTVDVYFGTEVPDPYRWLEDDNSEETGEWVKAQNEVTFDYLSKIPFRDAIKERLTKIWDYPKVSAPFKEGGHYFAYRNDGLQNQYVVYIKETLDGEEKVILDPNKLSEDGTVSLTGFEVSKCGKYLGYGISRGGSDWKEFYVKDIETGKDLEDHILWAKFSGLSWHKNGFFYSRYPEPKEGDELSAENKNSKIYYHTIGDKQENDKLIYENPEFPERGYYGGVTEDKKYLIISATESTSGNALYFKNLEEKDGELHEIVKDFDDDYQIVEHIDGKFLVMTNYESPKYKLISIDVNNYGKENWKDIIPESENVLKYASVVGGKIFVNYMQDAHSVIKVYDLEGNYQYDVELPTIGSVGGFSGEKDDEITFYTLTSYTYPSVVYKYNIAENKSEVYTKSQVDFEPDKYETKQVFYESKDGTKIPMFITHKKGLKLDGNNPTLLYGYGGFNVSLTPYFSITRLIWIENGGVYVVANLRGGGEYGEDWHEAGIKLKKQNVFDDFIAAAEYLIEKKYTSPKKLAIQGGSNGGLLVGAVANQRPELFKVAFPAVGVMDMLRYHEFTIGRFWAADYGTSKDSEEMFKYLINYSPIHSVKKDVEYPAMLVTTADHDDRVVPCHSFKYISTIQDNHKGNNPVLIRIETKAGHGAGKPTDKIIQEYADIWSFAFYNMGVTPEY
ncbi:MAG: S9 family peptidase [Bacteroidales bacterium]|nr:S9 family peptidase [Bacteroidales bacterium]